MSLSMHYFLIMPFLKSRRCVVVNMVVSLSTRAFASGSWCCLCFNIVVFMFTTHIYFFFEFLTRQ